MLKKIIFTCIILLLGIAMNADAQQSKEEIQRKSRELQRELAELNSSLSDIRKNRRQSVGELVLIQRKIRTRQELVDNIQDELSVLDKEIRSNTASVQLYQRKLDTLQKNYSKSLVFAYKNRNNFDAVNFLFSAKSFNDALKRYTYLKSYRKYRESQVANIKLMQVQLHRQMARLTKSKQSKGFALNNQSVQLTALEQDKKDKDSSIAELKSKEGELAVQIRDKNRARIKLRNLMDRIIAQEVAAERARLIAVKKQQEEADRRRRQEEAARKKAADEEAERQREIARKEAAERQRQSEAQRKAEAANNAQTSHNNTTARVEPVKETPKPVVEKPPVVEKKVERPAEEKHTARSTAPSRELSVLESSKESLTYSLDFEKNKGRLPWPVRGSVISEYGTHSVPGMESIKEVNDGIDIACSVGTPVRCVANGEVTYVVDLGGDYTVMVRHGKYFTAYSNLASVSVSKGTRVSAGSVLGSAAAGSDGGGMVNFMIANEYNNTYNPRRWLK